MVDGRGIVKCEMPIRVADGDISDVAVVLLVDTDDVLRGEPVNGGDHRRGDQPGIGERQEVETVVDDVEFGGPLEHLRDVEALRNLRIDPRVL